MSPPPTVPLSTPVPPDHPGWFAREVQPHDAQLKAYLRHSFPSVKDVDDVVQESYLRIWRARASREIQSAKAFLFRIARNLAVDALRRSAQLPADPGGDLALGKLTASEPSAAEALTERERLILLADAILALPKRCQDIVVLRKIHGLSQKETAARLGLSERTVENQHAIGVRKCEEFLRARGVHNVSGQ